jgi:hypothetical protein
MSKLRGLINLFCVNEKFFDLQPAEKDTADQWSYRSGFEVLIANGISNVH